MEIEIFSLSDYAVDNNGKLSVIGTFDTIFTHQVPTIHPSFYVAVKFRVANSEAGQHEFQIRGLTPDGKEIATIKAIGEVRPNANTGYSSTNIVVPFYNMKMDKLGKYCFEFYYDGEFRSGLSLHLVQLPIELNKAA